MIVVSRLRAGWLSLGWAHRLWFASVLLTSLVFLFLIPPFQTNDETSHWRRLWSTACGQLVCGHPIPALATDTLAAANYRGIRDGHQKFEFGRWDFMRKVPGTTRKENAGGNACVYVPIAYVLPALAMRPFMNVFDPREAAGMFSAFYAARAANWLLMAAGVLLFLLLVPALRNLTLVLYSLPTVMQQTVVVNQEATILTLTFTLIVLWQSRPRLATVLGMLAVVTALSAIKAIFLVLLLLWLATVLRWRRGSAVGRVKVGLILSLAALPVTMQAAWSYFVVRLSGKEFLPGWGVDPAAQLQHIGHHPLELLGVLWRGHLDLLGTDHMRGGWISVLGVLGWADLELGTPAYLALLGALLLAVLADAATESPRSDESGWLRYVMPCLSAYLMIPAVMVAMYLVFTPVGAPRPIGVQGRYLLCPYFLLLALGLDHLRRSRLQRRLRPIARVAILPWLCALLCLLADRQALRVVLDRFY